MYVCKNCGQQTDREGLCVDCAAEGREFARDMERFIGLYAAGFQLPPVHFSIDDEDDPDAMEANY